MPEPALRDRIRVELPQLSAPLADELLDVLQRVVDALQPDQVYLFGSHARGQAAPESDFDLLIVLPDDQRRLNRLNEGPFRGAERTQRSFDLITIGRERFRERSRAKASLASTVLREGHLLYGAPFVAAPYTTLERNLAVKEEVQDWLAKAEEDLAIVRVAQAFPAGAAMHIQQAAEKGLKALLAAHDRPVRKTHNIKELIRACLDVEPELGEFLGEADVLTPYAWRFRYPGDGPDSPDPEEAEELIGIASAIVRLARQRLESLPP